MCGVLPANPQQANRIASGAPVRRKVTGSIRKVSRQKKTTTRQPAAATLLQQGTRARLCGAVEIGHDGAEVEPLVADIKGDLAHSICHLHTARTHSKMNPEIAAAMQEICSIRFLRSPRLARQTSLEHAHGDEHVLADGQVRPPDVSVRQHTKTSIITDKDHTVCISSASSSLTAKGDVCELSLGNAAKRSSRLGPCTSAKCQPCRTAVRMRLGRGIGVVWYGWKRRGDGESTLFQQSGVARRNRTCKINEATNLPLLLGLWAANRCRICGSRIAPTPSLDTRARGAQTPAP